MSTNEIWKDIIGYEGLYQVSNLGRVKTIPRLVNTAISGSTTKRLLTEKIHKPCDNGRGYKYVCFKVNGGKVKHKYIHIMVAECFLTKLTGHCEVNHIDCDKGNNVVSNLEWCTKKENMLHAKNNNRINNLMGEEVSKSKLKNENVLFIRENYKKTHTAKVLANMFGVSEGYISNIALRKKWKHI